MGTGLSRSDDAAASRASRRLIQTMPALALMLGGVRAAVGFLVAAWRGAGVALSLAGVGVGAFLLGVRWGATPAWQAVWLGAALLAAIIAQSALYRLALVRPGIEPGGLQWGRAEGRLLAVWLLTAIFLFILGLLAFTALIASAYAVASAGNGFAAAEPATWARAVDGRGRFAVGAVAVAAAAALVWARMRICLAPAASVARGRVQVLSTWPITRGSAWPITAAWALISVGPMLLLLALSHFAPIAPATSWAIIVAVALAKGLVVAGLWLPLDAGLMSYLYRRLDPPSPASPPSP